MVGRHSGRLICSSPFSDGPFGYNSPCPHTASLHESRLPFLYLIRLLPFACCTRLPTRSVFLAYYAVKPRRKVGEVNLKKCFPELNDSQRTALLKRHFQHMAKLMLEYGLYWYAPADKLRSLVRYQDKHHLDEALAAGEKVIILIRTLPHLKWRFARSIRMCR